MRLIHTADWHLGQTLHQFDRSHEHQRFLDWLLDTLETEEADALLVAGDVFDTTNPSAASQRQLYRFLAEARRRMPRLNVVLTAGNHDSPGRLEAPEPFLEAFGSSVVGQVSRGGQESQLEKLLVPLPDPTGQPRAWVMAMPFLRPADLPRVEGADDGYASGIEALHRQVFSLAASRRQQGQAIIAMGHCHLTGGKESEESERRIVIGGAEAISSAIFDPGIAYVALGHLHLAQCIGTDGTRRYSGSPLPMSFSEIRYPHQVLVVDLDGENVGEVRPLRVPRPVELLCVPKQPAPLVEVVQALRALALPQVPEPEQPYLLVRVSLTQPEPGLRAEIESALEGKPVRFCRIETTHARGENPGAAWTAPSVDQLNALAPADFFRKLYLHRFGEDAPGPLLAAFTELLNANPEDAA